MMCPTDVPSFPRRCVSCRDGTGKQKPPDRQSKKEGKSVAKIVVLEGSPRIGGNTDQLSDELIRGAQENGNEVIKIYLAQKKIHFCIGCIS